MVALGGGVVGDLGGFAASVVRRGVDYVQVPTTLLAQVDSSVGGKTAINARQGKNLIGAFYQPILVVADTALLDTLPEREFRAGYAEVVKYGLLGDADFFDGSTPTGATCSPAGHAREHAIAVSCRAKAAIVARDERETGDRMLLNLGHTFGHAFEAAAGFSDKLLHGEAIGLGMSLAFEFSARRGLIAKADADRVIAHLAAVGLPTHVKAVPGGNWPDDRCDDGSDLAGQEGPARPAHLHPGARHRPGLRHPRCRCGRGSRLPRRKALSAMTDTIVSLLIAIFLLAANAFYVAAEFALVKSRGFRIDAMAEQNRFGARLLQEDAGQHRGLSRVLPARHHHGLARPRLGR